MNIIRGPRTLIHQRLTSVLASDTGTLISAGPPEVWGEGLFQHCGGEGTVATPTRAPRIHAFPATHRPQSVAAQTIHVQPFVGQSGLFEPMVSDRQMARFEYLVSYYTLTQSRLQSDFTGGVISALDVMAHIQSVIMTGENPKVPGRFVDPATGLSINIDTPDMREVLPLITADLTVHYLFVGVRLRLHLTTGAVA